MKLIVFEDDGLGGFGPLTLTRHSSQLRWGTKTLLDSVFENTTDASGVSLWGREELKQATEEALGEAYNEEESGWVLLVNSRARPDKRLLSLTAKKTPFAAFAGSRLVAGRMNAALLRPGVLTARSTLKAAKGLDKLEVAGESLFGGYWDLVESNGLAVAEQARRFDDPLQLPNLVEVRGPRSSLSIHGRADVELHVTFDTRLGPIVVEEGASVESFSRVMGPSYIGPKTKVLSALIGGGTSLFSSCKVGGQVENSIIMPYTNKAHSGYIGDSYVGEWVNLGAGSTFSNLKNTYGNVRLDVGRRKIDSGMLKLGPVLGDMSKVSIGALVYSGRLLGTGCQVAGLASKNVPSFTYSYGSGRMVELLLESVLETQRRMMERRGQTLTRAGEALIRKVFRDTSEERRKAGVRKGRFP